MHTKIATAIVLSLAFASQPRGWVSSVAAAADASAGTYQITVRGNNPCGSVHFDFGDGTAAATHAIQQLPVTIPHEFSRAGEYTIRARGQGNCDGDVFTRVNVSTVRSGFDRRQNRFGEMDQNGDGVITRAEWRGNAQAFYNHDWNNDGRLSGEEVRPGGKPQYSWTEATFRRLDRNRDKYLSGNEWRYEPDDFLQVDRNRDDRVSLSEFMNGDSALGGYEMPGGRGRGQGRGRGNEQPFQIMVTNGQTWTDTGIEVRAGDQLDISAMGIVRFSRQPNDSTDANGVAIRRPRAPMPNVNVGALIARVGNAYPFFVGARATALRVQQTGRLYLAINDDILTDNSGEFRVTVDVNGRGRGR